MAALIPRPFPTAELVAGAALALLAAALIAGCKSNACSERPTEAQINIRVRSAKNAPLTTRVELRVNDGPKLVRLFYVISPSFRFSFGDLDRPPRKLEITVIVADRFGRVVARGAGSFKFVASGCNFFELQTGSPDDGGMLDAPALDAMSDAAALDTSPRDARPDAAVDARADTTDAETARDGSVLDGAVSD